MQAAVGSSRERVIRVLCLAALAAVAWVMPAQAQGPRAKPIHFIVNSAPGNGTDIVGRLVAAELAKSLGPVVVENRAGGYGYIALEAVKKAPADRDTYLVAAHGAVNRQAIDPQAPYDLVKDFEPVASLGTIEFFLVVNTKAVPVANAQEFLRHAKGRNDLTFASGAVGSTHHLGMELLKHQAGFEALHVPYKGVGQSVPDLISGRVHMIFTGLALVSSHISKGAALRILAIGAPRRSPLQPDVPTFAEAGVPGIDVKDGFMVLAASGTPRNVINELNGQINKVLLQKDIQAQFAKNGITADPGTPEELGRELRASLERWTRVVKAAGIKAD
jgi:tripartite-type tricarboxylate transporter receptor subunit TctC